MATKAKAKHRPGETGDVILAPDFAIVYDLKKGKARDRERESLATRAKKRAKVTGK